MRPIDILNDGKLHHFAYAWGAEIDECPEALYVDGKAYTDPEEVREAIGANIDTPSGSGSADLGWHKSFVTLRQASYDSLVGVERSNCEQEF